MDFTIPDNWQSLGDEAREFAQTSLASDVVERDRRGAKDPGDWQGLWKKMADYGLFGLVLPQDLGGSGYSFAQAAHILEEIGYGLEDSGLLLGLNAQIWPMQMPILEFGNPAQKETLKRMAKGELICAHAITESVSGSDAMSLATTAREVEGGFVLNGHKTYIGMSTVCDVALVFATHDPKLGAWGISAFLVDMTSNGITRGHQAQKMGTRTLPIGDLVFEECFVPQSALLGRKGAGSAIFNRSLEWERRFIYSSHVGAMRRQLDQSVSFAKEREVFGEPIGNYQSISNRLADMKTRYETSRLLLRKAAWEADQGIRDAGGAAMTKLHISEAYLASSMDAVRTFGGKGYMQSDGIERALRDAVGGVIYGGTSDIQRQIIAKHLK